MSPKKWAQLEVHRFGHRGDMQLVVIHDECSAQADGGRAVGVAGGDDGWMGGAENGAARWVGGVAMAGG